jgi:hypothetical protein
MWWVGGSVRRQWRMDESHGHLHRSEEIITMHPPIKQGPRVPTVIVKGNDSVQATVG